MTSQKLNKAKNDKFDKFFPNVKGCCSKSTPLSKF